MVLPIFKGHLLDPLALLFLDDDFILYVYETKNLVVTFNYDISWGDHVCTIYRKVYGALAELRRLADVTPFVVCMRLIVVFVIPFFT
jgi:hypothetical protein